MQHVPEHCAGDLGHATLDVCHLRRPRAKYIKPALFLAQSVGTIFSNAKVNHLQLSWGVIG